MTDAPDPFTLAGAIRRALRDITDHYDMALIPPRMTGSLKLPTTPTPPDVRKIKPARKVFEHSPAPVSLAVLDARRETHMDLAHYTRVVLNEVNDGTIATRVNGESPRDLARFLDVWALHLAEQLPDEAVVAERDLDGHARRLRAFALPNRRDWVKLGRCPFVVEGVFCRGEVRGYGEEGQATCTGCEQYGPTEWWEEVLIGAVGDTLTHDQLIPFIHRTFGRAVKRATLRTWLRRGVLVSSGTDALGRTLYNRDAVVWSLTRTLAA